MLYVVASYTVGTLVTIASATDDDADENSLITYSITSEKPLPFEIDPFNGEVRYLNSCWLTALVDRHFGRFHITI